MVKDMDEEEEDFFDTDADMPVGSMKKGLSQVSPKN
jgi:hypothetical protein